MDYQFYILTANNLEKNVFSFELSPANFFMNSYSSYMILIHIHTVEFASNSKYIYLVRTDGAERKLFYTFN